MADGNEGTLEHDAGRQPGPAEALAATSHVDLESRNIAREDNGPAIGNDTAGPRHSRPPAQGLRLTEGSHGLEEASIASIAVGGFYGPTTYQSNDYEQNVDTDLAHSHQQLAALKHTCSLFDLKITIRFIVVIFGYSLGFATAYSVYVPTNRSSDALPSPRSDTYPVMVAQVTGSLVSPLLFGVVSVRNTSTPLQRQVTSFYYLLLALGVLTSIVSLLLYSLWPAGYRAVNVVTIASLMLSILGGWQSLEKDWKEATETHEVADDIELGDQQS